MSVAELLQAVQFVVKSDGQPVAVQMDMPTWEALLTWLEDGEDRQVVKAKLERLRQGPRAGDAISWETARPEWGEAETSA